ncbi:MAG: methylmalonyl-CoA mutase family protein, partial [Propionibacteriaceae bacterium]|nr:methylmalonyl-CoA mutase family protein [Propionibacteriaceae bacterium]
MADETVVLAGDFPQPAPADWDREVLKIMNRRRPPGTELTIEQAMKRLTSVYPDGLVVDPLYTRPDDEAIGYPGQDPFTRGAEPPAERQGLGWDPVQLHEDPDVGRSHQAVLDDLNAGCTGVWLRVDEDAIAPADVAAVLAGVIPEAAFTAVTSVGQQGAAAAALLDVWAAAARPGGAVGNLGIDPLGAAAVTGAAADLAGLGDWVRRLEPFPKARALAVDVRPYDNAGAGDIDQVAYGVATGLEYVRALAAQGVPAAAGFG